MDNDPPPARALRRPTQAMILLGFIAVIAGAVALGPKAHPGVGGDNDQPGPAHPDVFHPTASQWATLVVAPVESHAFRTQLVTDGRIAVDEDRSTPIFSPYSGLVKRLAAKPGDAIAPGQLLFTLEAADMVQAQNDFIVASAALETARSQLNLAQINEKRQHDLYDAKAVPLKEWQQSQADLVAAQNTRRSAEIALEAVRNRLRILQKSEDEIAAFEKTGKINPETPIYAPIAGSIVQRKVGPGQYVSSGASDPVFVVGDLSAVWLIANVRESDASKVEVGETVEATVLAYPDRAFSARIDYVAAAVDSNTRRLQVRATMSNPDKLLKPEMFASVSIIAGPPQISPAVPREAIIYEGDSARVWVATEDRALALRLVKLGLVNDNFVQVVDGLSPGEQIIVKGSLFIDRAASGESS